MGWLPIIFAASTSEEALNPDFLVSWIPDPRYNFAI
jgi:hypothetical protein